MDSDFLEGLWVAAQPIVDLSTGDIIGYESLIRGQPASTWASPAQLFAEARRQGQGAALETQCRMLGLAWGSRHLTGKQKLFLNIDGAYSTLALTARPPLTPSRIALEISEAHNTLEHPDCLQQIQRWRESGFQIVIDDYGVGYAGLGLVLAVQPHIVKIDRLLIAGIDHHTTRQSMVTHFRELALDQGITLLAEGIETEAELRVLQQIGIPLGQGFLLGRPQPAPISSPVRVAVRPSIDVPRRGLPPSDGEILQKAAEMAYETPFPTYVVTRSRQIVAWNQAAVAATGWSKYQMEQHRCHEQRLNHRDLKGHPLCVGACPLVWTMVKNHAHKQPVVGFAADGARLAIEILSTPLWNPVTHKMVGAVEYFWDLENIGTADLKTLGDKIREITGGQASLPSEPAPAVFSQPFPAFAANQPLRSLTH
ncbi:MAG: EAL domain-containing protein [Thermaerobacter sp.]|nr:EAL domain-containing protein [Thermaerobacter sp.]